MTPPSMTKTPLVRPYVQANAGVINYPNAPFSPSVTAEGGAKLHKDNWDAQAGVRVGTDIGASLSAGYTLPLSERSHTSLKFGAGVSYDRALVTEGRITNTVSVGDQSYSVSKSTHPDLYKGYVEVGVNFAPSDKVDITIGAEGGVRGSSSGKRYSSTSYTAENGKLTNLKQDVGFKGKVGAYGTPTIDVQYKPNDKLALGINADLNNIGATATWTF